MNPSFGWPNMKAHPIIPVALSVVLVLLPGCAARMAQQEIDTLREQMLAVRQAAEEFRLDTVKRAPNCRGAHKFFIKFILRPDLPEFSDSRLWPLLDYHKRVLEVQQYMDEKKITVETALTVMGDLVLPPALPSESDPFNGCVMLLGRAADEPIVDRSGKFADDFGFYWGLRDWREDEESKMLDKHLPPAKRIPFIRLRAEYASALTRTLNERIEKGEITFLQFIKVINAASRYLTEHIEQYEAQLRENLVSAKAQDDALLTTVAVGLGAVATAALAVSAVSANYRIANAQTAMANTMQLQALQAPAPIRCNYTLPGRYGTQGYIYCR